MTYFKKLPSTLRSRTGSAAAVLGAAVLIAGCGSGGSSTITVGNENTADNTLIKSTEKTSSTSTTSTTATAKTPTTGPLSKEPKVTVPTGAAPSKLETKDLITGTGAEAKDGDTVTVNYVGVLYKGGKEFDASWKRNEPFSFTLGKGQVIAGWDQGVAGMKVGGRRELIIPAALGYGAKGSGAAIPPNAPLVFVVDLLGV
ncbi:MAG TPA: FKBP-type peptidyl-prolyl cis-trans isomerase [Solirubrobacteraceae bacterium]|nr:FKBP-type peptidyl-prolyl cis-trans isomerase [Solirubrobacteraceae bacterium]